MLLLLLLVLPLPLQQLAGSEGQALELLLPLLLHG